MRYRYDITKGKQKIKTKLAAALTVLSVAVVGFGAGLAFLPGLSGALSANWNPVGAYTIDFTCTTGCGGTYSHHMDITSYHHNNGNFSGTGYYLADNSYTWNVTGNLTGSNINFHVLYTGSNPGYTLDATGTVANTGTLSGTATGPGQTFTWVSSTGAATAVSFKDFEFIGNTKPSQCGSERHELIDVHFKIINDYDSGVHGNAWANDTINRSLTIWQTGEDTYCAIVKDKGMIVTFDGDSPNGTGHVGAGIKGEMFGGYRTTQFSGTYIGNANYNTHGNLGTFNLMCTDANTCPGTHPSYASYFSSTSGDDLAWWGWQYNTCHNGNWANSIDGNYGDITGNAPLKNKLECGDDRDHGDHDQNHQDNDDHQPVFESNLQ
jgi:hypothetical protein